jgi:hypothetical protein
MDSERCKESSRKECLAVIGLRVKFYFRLSIPCSFDLSLGIKSESHVRTELTHSESHSEFFPGLRNLHHSARSVQPEFSKPYRVLTVPKGLFPGYQAGSYSYVRPAIAVRPRSKRTTLNGPSWLIPYYLVGGFANCKFAWGNSVTAKSDMRRMNQEARAGREKG